MVPFKLPHWRKRHIREKYQAHDSIIWHFSMDMERVMREAADEIISHGMKTGRFPELSLHKMNMVTEDFYRRVIEKAFHSAKNEKSEQQGKMRLSKLPIGLPKNLKDLRQVFNDRRYWQRIMKRSNLLTNRLKKQYLQKLREQFKTVMPKINSGSVTPEEAKATMVEVWGASKARVETIFRTETTNYFSDVQVKFFENDDEIIGFLFDSVRDSSRTEICRSRHGLIYRPKSKELKDNTPGCHYNCRSHLIALANTLYNRKLLEEPNRDPSKVKVVPLPEGWK